MTQNFSPDGKASRRRRGWYKKKERSSHRSGFGWLDHAGSRHADPCLLSTLRPSRGRSRDCAIDDTRSQAASVEKEASWTMLQVYKVPLNTCSISCPLPLHRCLALVAADRLLRM